MSSVFPDEARVGNAVTVRGQNFGSSQNSSTLDINGVEATVIHSWSDNEIIAEVPVDAASGNVTVTVGGVAGAPGFLIVPWQATNPDNVIISAAVGDQVRPQLTSDGNGGAIMVWQDGRNGLHDIYAQHINSAGVVQWTADGLAISTATNTQPLPQLTSDGNGGVIMVWEDGRNGIDDIYAQGITRSGLQ